MIQYGLISETDAKTIEKTLSLIMQEFPNDYIITCEVGIHNGETSRGMAKYLQSNNRKFAHTAIDNQQDFKMGRPYEECLDFLIGDSVEMSARLVDDFYHFCFIDANHSFHKVIADFVAYTPKIKKGGYLLFHDTNPNIVSYKDYQKVGSEAHENMYISVRRALKAIGLFDNAFPEWELIFDEFDQENEAGGICVFKKIGN